MATSGISISQLSRDTLIKASLRKLSVLAKGQTPDTEDYSNAATALDTLLAEFRTLGMLLWARNSYSFSPTLSTTSYEIGVGKTLNTPYPIKMIQAYRTDSGNTTHVPMELISDFNFNQYPSSSGTPLQLRYQPLVNYGVIKLWPTPDSTSTTSTITIVYQRPFEYFTASGDTLDMPEHWYNAVIYGLAVLLAPEWGIPLEDRRELKADAKEHLDRALEFSNEDSSLFFQPG